MTKFLTNDFSVAATGGVNYDLNPPCVHHNFEHASLDFLFKTTLPTYLTELGKLWDGIHSSRTSGLIDKGVDDAVVDGEFDEEIWDARGGPLPCMAGAAGSRGIPEVWPHTKNAPYTWKL